MTLKKLGLQLNSRALKGSPPCPRYRLCPSSCAEVYATTSSGPTPSSPHPPRVTRKRSPGRCAAPELVDGFVGSVRLGFPRQCAYTPQWKKPCLPRSNRLLQIVWRVRH